MLTGAGKISIDVDLASHVAHLSIDLMPARAGVNISVNDTGIGDWKHVTATVSPSVWNPFVARLLELLSVSEGDVGTHGFWVSGCTIQLPLSASAVDVSATHADKLSTEPVVQHILSLIDEVAKRPGGQATSWRAARLRRRLVAAAGLAALAVAALALVYESLR